MSTRSHRGLKRLCCSCLCFCALGLSATAAPQAVPEKPEAPGPSDLTESPVKAPISGRVRFPAGMMPAEAVHVRLETHTGRRLEQVTTGADGFFTFRRVVCGFYVLAVDVAGYQPLRVPIEHSFIPADGLQLTMREGGESSDSLAVVIPASALHAYQKGQALFAKKKDVQGAAAMQKAIELFPAFEEANAELALHHLGRKDLTAARDVLEKAAKHGQHQRILLLLGRTARLQGDLARAVDALRGSLALHESSWIAQWEMAESLNAQSRFAEAAPHAARAHELNAGIPAIHQLHYNLLIRQSQYAPALAELDEFLRLFPSHSLALKARQQRAALAAKVGEPSVTAKNP